MTALIAGVVLIALVAGALLVFTFRAMTFVEWATAWGLSVLGTVVIGVGAFLIGKGIEQL
ncbi:hypothetical protein BI081_gp028 [Mycobacterium phage Tonenili]|uniref:Uncharacterized protein n=1 Tax=Mycobacterium phage Tonenili TaxID=1891703 RepID=A0A1C9EH08_9CAUD|nr:hypothetical protein BI081_gp028 [Mycobacterium phage Tonenili]AON96779.1 hypothetical protein SEA_TONENILI_28 [Mycobacterium phage Tonenili]